VTRFGRDEVLGKGRARRHATTAALDLRRRLETEPSVPRRRAPGIAFGKLVRRNKLAFVASSSARKPENRFNC